MSRRAPGLLIALALGAAAPAADDPLSPEDLEARRAALEKWTFEPMAIDGGVFLFHMDRRDSSFFILERRTGVKWFSSWGRRGFASVLVAAEDGAPDGAERWLPIDRLKSVVASGKTLRIACASSAGELTGIRMEVRLIEGTGGISLVCEVEGAARAHVKAVRLLDDALWTSDAGGGGSLVPAGPGEWIPADDPREARIVLDGVAGRSPLTLLGLGIMSGKSPLLVRWTDPSATLRIERRRVASDAFPGRVGTFHGLEIRIAPGEGPATARVDLHPGSSEMGISDTARGLREIELADFRRSLRHRASLRSGLATFPSAALFRPRLGPGQGPEAVAAFAERLRRDLGIEDAAFIASGWKEEDREGLSACSSRVRALGFMFGLEASASPEGGTKPEDLSRLGEIASPDIVLLEMPPLPADPEALAAALEARSAYGERVAETFGLVGMKGRAGIDARYAALIEGALEPWSSRASLEGAWPFLPAVVGSAARLTVDAGSGLRAGADALLLAHLIAGETPLYALPGAPGGEEKGAYARDEGWCAGKGLSPDERFIKNTYEASAHLANLRARNPMIFHRKLDAPGEVRESFFGLDLRVLVNFGPGNYEDADDGVVLPPGGFFIKHPNLLAFHALRAGGVSYERPAFFVVRSLEGKMYLRADRVSIYRGFGPDRIDLGGKTFQVDRESIVKIW